MCRAPEGSSVNLDMMLLVLLEMQNSSNTSRAKESRRRPVPLHGEARIKSDSQMLREHSEITTASAFDSIANNPTSNNNQRRAAGRNTRVIFTFRDFCTAVMISHGDGDGTGAKGDARERASRLTCPRAITPLHWRDSWPFRNAERRTVFSLHCQTCHRPRRSRFRIGARSRFDRLRCRGGASELVHGF